LTIRRELKRDRVKNQQQASTSQILPMVVEAPSPNSAEPVPIIEEPEDIESDDSTDDMDAEERQMFTPGGQRITKRKRPKRQKAVRPPVRHSNREIALRRVPIEVDYHFFTPGASSMLGDPRALFDDSMPTKKRRMEYHIQMPEVSAGHSSALAAGPSRAAIGAANQNVALPAPKSMAAITGPSQQAIGPMRSRQLAIEMTPEYQPEYQLALREMQEIVPKKKKKHKVKRPY
jgi:hypothetical protein